MVWHLLGRLLIALPTLFLISLLTFFVGALAGESYYEKLKANPNADLAQIRADERAEKLHEPLPWQYLHWLRRVCFDVFVGRPQHRVDDLEDAPAQHEDLRVTNGVLQRVHDDAVSGRYSYRVLAAGVGPVEVEVDSLGRFVCEAYTRSAEEPARTDERFPRPVVDDASFAQTFDALVFAIRGDDGTTLQVAVRDEVGNVVFAADEAFGRGEPWRDVVVPIEVIRVGTSLLVGSNATFRLDDVRLRERSWTFAVGTPNFGRSAKFARPALAVLRPYFFNTIVLGVLALLVTWSVALPVGVHCGVRRGSWADRFFSLLAFLGMSVPSFFLALIALYLGGVFVNDLGRAWFDVQIFPVGGAGGEGASWIERSLDRLHHLVLPVLVISAGTIAGLQRITRGNLIEVLRAHYVRTARAKGLDERRVVYRHALRNALNPLITLFGYQLAALLSGQALVEIIFNYPGLGTIVLDAIREQDRNLVMATVLLSGLLLILSNLLADVLIRWIDPRIRLQGGES
ncbi:MAG: ABC transporter permease [Planctomycetes bacterium]|nr:ABC transporter permease [Planctomycetota bacterium]